VTAVVVDTCVVSFLLKNDTRAELYRPHLDVDTKVISFMTLAELLPLVSRKRLGRAPSS
jgi:predicted nucleic acid-binding protein